MSTKPANWACDACACLDHATSLSPCMAHRPIVMPVLAVIGWVPMQPHRNLPIHA